MGGFTLHFGMRGAGVLYPVKLHRSERFSSAEGVKGAEDLSHLDCLHNPSKYGVKASRHLKWHVKLGCYTCFHNMASSQWATSCLEAWLVQETFFAAQAPRKCLGGDATKHECLENLPAAPGVHCVFDASLCHAVSRCRIASHWLRNKRSCCDDAKQCIESAFF